MDSVFIDGLRIETLIGIYPHERKARQPVVLTVTLGYAPRAITDISQAIDYGAVVAALRAFVGGRTDGLLETLADACAAMLKLRFPAVRTIDLVIDKPLAATALDCARAGVRIHREFT
ncbi:MAG: dihydroneopterin aldolase [Rhodanobacteraceae bacterium]|nr:MAG: dihydroneopterin aldolase [Rhodanobacteraceae bacterium]